MCYSRYTPKLFADLGNKSRADYIVLPSSENVSTPPGEKTDGWTRLAKFKYRIVCGGHSCLFVAWKNAGGCLHLVLLLHQVCCLRLIHNIYIYIVRYVGDKRKKRDIIWPSSAGESSTICSKGPAPPPRRCCPRRMSLTRSSLFTAIEPGQPWADHIHSCPMSSISASNNEWRWHPGNQWASLYVLPESIYTHQLWVLSGRY